MEYSRLCQLPQKILNVHYSLKTKSCCAKAMDTCYILWNVLYFQTFIVYNKCIWMLWFFFDWNMNLMETRILPWMRRIMIHKLFVLVSLVSGALKKHGDTADLLILLTCSIPQLIEPLGQDFGLLQGFVCLEKRERFNTCAVFVY